ncbi:MAG: D-alanine--D-alanine ligase [Thermodesulfobacteriota bacterium]|nr:D-alanine--D-alanine ligase [Thermodesulfobacteriota bacterium]
MDRVNIALLAGGWSGEREISLKSGEAVYHALSKEKYDVTMYDPLHNLTALVERKEEIDLAFILLHGKYGEDGCIQGLLDIFGIPFVGSGVLSSAMALNKSVSKEMFRSTGLTVAEDIMLRRGESFSATPIIERLGLTTVVKPVAEGSSLGTSVCRTREELVEGIEKAFRFNQDVMVEKYIDGLEVTCCVLGNRTLETLPLIEIMPGTSYRFFDYNAKYTADATREICPARLSRSLTERAWDCAKMAHKALKCSVWSRTDMIIQDETIYLLETNTLPGMTENSLFPLAAKAAGLSFPELLDRLIFLSLELAGEYRNSPDKPC